MGMYDQALNASEIGYLYANGTITPAHAYPFGYGGGGIPAITISNAYPAGIHHYNALTWNGSIIFEAHYTPPPGVPNCSINDTTRFERDWYNGTHYRYTPKIALPDRNYTITISCNRTGTTSSSSWWWVYDTVNPVSIHTTPTNNSHHKLNFTLDTKFYDSYLWRANATIRNASGNIMYNRYSGNLLNASQHWYNISKQINISGGSNGTWQDGQYSLKLEATDSHTASTFSEQLIVTKDTKSPTETIVKYTLTKGDVTMTVPKEVDVTTIKADDRFIFKYDIAEPKPSYIILKANSVERVLNSEYNCHFVLNNAYWWDCEGLKDPHITKIDKSTYRIDYIMDAKTVTTESMGGLNYDSWNYVFFVDLKSPTFTGNHSYASPTDFYLYFNTSELVRYNYNVSATSCGGAPIDGGSWAGSSATHFIYSSGLTINSTYYVNITIIDAVNHTTDACYGITTDSASIVMNSLNVHLNHATGQMQAYANATSYIGNTLAYECLWTFNSTTTWNKTYPLPPEVPLNFLMQENATSYSSNGTTTWAAWIGYLFDANYSTRANSLVSTQDAVAIAHYTKPAGIQNTSIIWQVMDYGRAYDATDPNTGRKTNLTLPWSCHNMSATEIKLRIQSAPGQYVYWSCCNASRCNDSQSYYPLRTFNTNFVGYRAYEEAIFWPMNRTILNTVPEDVEYHVSDFTPNLTGPYSISCRATNGTYSSAYMTLGLGWVPYVNWTILNEMNVSPMDVSNIREVRLDSFCSNKRERWNLTASSGQANLTCLPEYINLWFIYNDTVNYYRTVRPSVSLYDNITFYMIDLFSEIAVLWDVQVEDLTGGYTGVPFLVKKLTHYNGTITVIDQLLDLENKAHLYLIKGETYDFIIDGTVQRVIGNMLAATAASKIISLPALNFNFTTLAGTDISSGILLNLTSNTLKVMYSDASGSTQWINVDIYNATDNSLITSYNATGSNLSYTIAAKGNESYKVDMSAYSSIWGIINSKKTVGARDPGIDLTWLYDAGTPELGYLKSGISVATMIGTAMIFPAQFVVAGIFLILVEIFVFTAWQWLSWSPYVIGLFIAILGIEAVRLVWLRR